jgi:hypothetical protein
LVLSPPLQLLMIFLSDDHAGTILAGVGTYELIINICTIVALVCLNILFFKKKAAFPRSIIIFLVVRFALILIDTLAIERVMHSSAEDVSGLAWSFIGASIWVPYFLVSRRVKATFVR